MNRTGEMWRPIPCLDGYEASTDGRIRSHKGKDGSARILTPYIRRHNGKATEYRIVFNVDGTSKSFQVGRLIFTTWIGVIPDGKIVYCRDGDVTNTRVGNLALGDNTERFRQRAKKIGGPNRKPVLKVDDSLEVVDAYRSAREAARLNGFEHKIILNYCNLQVKTTVFAPDGFIYIWDDAKWLRRMMKRAMPEMDKKGIRYTDPGTEEYWNLPIETEPDETGMSWEEALPISGGGTALGCLNKIGA